MHKMKNLLAIFVLLILSNPAFAGLKAIATPSAQSGSRNVLTATTNFYVTTTGNDSNPCTLALPCLTINRALNYVQSNYDLGGQTVNINVADGTYTTPVALAAPFVGGVPNLIGDIAAPANCIVSTTNANAMTFSNGVAINIEGFKLQTTTSGIGLEGTTLSVINVIGAMNYGATAGIQIAVISGAQLNITTNYTVSGSATAAHLLAGSNGLAFLNGITVTFTGTPALTTYYNANNLGNIQASSMTYSGAVGTTTKYSATANGLIDTNGGCSSIPGTTAGSASTQGQCL
jgi:hypothetical protein